MAIKLGDRVKDTITGFEGIVTAYTQWLHGCDRLSVEGTSLTGHGFPVGAETFDIMRLEKVPHPETVQPRTSKDTPPGQGIG